MFDDITPSQNKNPGKAVAGAPAAPRMVEDIFLETDQVKNKNAAKPSVFQPKPLLPKPDIDAQEEGGSGGKKLFFLGLGILMIALLVYGGYWAFAKYGKVLLAGQKTVPLNNASDTVNPGVVPENPQTQAPSAITDNPVTQTPPVTEQPATTTTSQPIAEPAVATATSTVDSDGDGLTDWEEINIYHTDPHNIDTDGDGLFDREEVKVYHTNPLVKDTDGDGFNDGDEVKSGYNPNGPGKLYDINKK